MIKLISIDLFETLVDLSSDRHLLWQQFLGDDVSTEQTEDAWNFTGQLVYQFLDEVNANCEFRYLNEIFHDCFVRAFDYLDASFDPWEAVDFLMDYHANRPWFPEAKLFLEAVDSQSRICLSSDTDHAMVGDHVRDYPFDRQFTSEALGCYKGDEQNRFFEAVIHHYEFEPNEILHVGDSTGELIAAKRVGIQTCWINRNGQEWSKDQLPDYQVSSLDQISFILNT